MQFRPPSIITSSSLARQIPGGFGLSADFVGLLFYLNSHIRWNCKNSTHLWPGRLDLTQIGRLACRRHWQRSVQTQPPFPPAQKMKNKKQKTENENGKWKTTLTEVNANSTSVSTIDWDKNTQGCYKRNFSWITQLSPTSRQTTGSWEDTEDPDALMAHLNI